MGKRDRIVVLREIPCDPANAVEAATALALEDVRHGESRSRFYGGCWIARISLDKTIRSHPSQRTLGCLSKRFTNGGVLMYGHVGLRASLLGAGASTLTGAIGGFPRPPAPLLPLLLLAGGGLTLYLTACLALLALAVAFRLRPRPAPVPVS